MVIKYPKFDKKIFDHIEDAKFKGNKTRPGTIMIYNSGQNTATVMVDEKFSSSIRKYVTQCTLPIYLWRPVCCPISWNPLLGWV
jgi:hypothetical protein